MTRIQVEDKLRNSMSGFLSISDAPGVIAIVALLVSWAFLSAGDLHDGFLALGVACIAGGIEGTLRIHYGALVIGGPAGIVLMIVGAYA